ncbi:PDR/VanB family oxidoreductase [Streptomyces zagrosensis]|uniref:Ferredoxin-NADP reductase n=1 Tax=Streptomyces zagrosensis TaxID=1042984 RepID=A0A7W9Q5W6_9ACTN|nr:PDR/VanB family oxidoreductase [Streptomyces zagrosensis]MBB5933342.1 ferredoxin-NADP reductase [Streptomyces zagrosensis]
MARVPLPRPRTVIVVAAAALLVKRAMGRRVQQSPLWPMPALEDPISGRGRSGLGGATLRLLVTERQEAAEGVVQLRLTGSELPPWQPGAHLDLVLPSGTIRQFSLCGDPADSGSYTIATRLIAGGRGGSREVHEQVHEGEEIEVRGPRNRFPLVDAPAYVFIAGGIGITPILPMLRAAEEAGTPWRLLYGGRSLASMPFVAEVEKLGGPEKVTLVPEDERGLPDLAGALADAPDDAAVYCCGPDGLMDAVAELYAAGAPGGGLHMERFAPGGNRHRTGVNGAFEVELRRTGATVDVGPETSVLAAIREQALPDLAYSCAQGFCGTCLQRVIAGDIDHRDELLTDAERDDQMLICVSRVYGDKLVLDL